MGCAGMEASFTDGDLHDAAHSSALISTRIGKDYERSIEHWWPQFSVQVFYTSRHRRINFVLCGGKTRLFRQWPITAACMCLSRPNTKYPPRQSRRAIDNYMDGAVL
jgi:hypothetical protein